MRLQTISALILAGSLIWEKGAARQEPIAPVKVEHQSTDSVEHRRKSEHPRTRERVRVRVRERRPSPRRDRKEKRGVRRKATEKTPIQKDSLRRAGEDTIRFAPSNR
jgi:hypothetical protein